MKNKLLLLQIATLLFACSFTAISQSVGIGTVTPAGRLHVVGNTNISQFIIDASNAQTNVNPLLKLRSNIGADLLWLHSDNQYNTFLGLNAGRVNDAVGGAVTNTFIGSSSGYSNTTGHSNTSLGYSALYANNTGYENTATGRQALGSNTTGAENTASGFKALFYNTSASQNVAIGNYALYGQSYNPGASWNSQNVAIGFSALYFNQPTAVSNGINNTAIGATALYSNTVGYNNTATGTAALWTNVGGIENSAYGYQAMYSNNNGNYNTAIGSLAMYSNNTGTFNTAIGASSLNLNTSGSYNTATGRHALYANTIGDANTSNGYRSLYSNTAASQNTALGFLALFTQSYNPGNKWNSDNVAIGYGALFANQPSDISNGVQNTATGSQAMYTNSIGSNNTANGYAALYSNSIGSQNTAFGQGAMYANTSGLQNAAFGYSALSANINGLYNTAIGTYALYYLVGGDQNIAIGRFSGTSNGSPNIFNTISIGNGGYLNAASNQAFIGNLSTTWTGGNTTWFTYASDARVKDNVQEDVKGLDFIIRLRPVTYNLNIRSMAKITGNKETEDFPEKYDVEKIKQTGFIAQEIEKAAKESGYNFSGVTIPKKETELYTVSYAQFVVPLVKAVQEQQLMIEALQKKSTVDAVSAERNTIEQQQSMIIQLQQQVSALEKRLAALEAK